MTYLPCADEANDPEDWFIEKDGLQYAWEPLVTEQDGVDPPAREVAEERAKKAALVRRRHARDKCHTLCERRLDCLGLAIDGDRPDFEGIRGGYFQEQLKKIVDEREKKRQEREARRAAVAAGE